MDKGALHYWWRRFGIASLIVLVVLWVVTALAAVYVLRQNNLQMLRLRDEVFLADKDNQNVNDALKRLQNYVTSHMNTNLPKLGDEKAIQLKYTYERLVVAEDARISTEREKVAQDARVYCEKNLPAVRLTERAVCVQEYIASRPATARIIPKELYTFDFISPRWSPDVAGWLIVVFIAITILLVVRIISGLLVRHNLRQ